MNTLKFRPVLSTVCLGLLLGLASGCGSAPAGPQADPNEAQNTMKLVLDAWKSGQNPSQFSQKSPDIVIQDSDWTLGLKLVSYQTQNDVRLAGNDVHYPVTLELKSPKGRVVKKHAVYLISTSPKKLVLRHNG